ncbi:hypothetical protein GTZ99_02980 [Novosphingobium sp. FSY-8]|uniref:Uncharacterized protein n=1 Tax=Novosphingobium ovatum TaxID=1908523 RepID=A0ABW9XAF2_9SPHN|nr:hypothetical protein [Novosphingobium ovatum]NBC35515.1 hypothetical protein [Novosphingobium ovatum]
MIRTPRYGDAPPNARSRMARRRYEIKEAARKRHRNYSIGFASALQFWKEYPSPECWGWTTEGPLPRRKIVKRHKRRVNIAKFRAEAHWLPF